MQVALHAGACDGASRHLIVRLRSSSSSRISGLVYCCQGDRDTGTDASARRKSQLPACAQHVANVCTFSGDRSGFVMSFHLIVSR